MKETYLLPVWAPRVKPYLIRRLYESDAQGMLDVDLVDEVGWDLYSRCDSFIQADAAKKGRVRCPNGCHVVIAESNVKGMLRCPACGWECPRQAYLKTIRNQQLDGGPEVIEWFQNYIDTFPKAKEPSEKMLLIDSLIHGFHHFLRSGRTRRPVAINLLDGHLEFVIDFLDHLSFGSGSTAGVQQTHQNWQDKIHPYR